MGEPIRIDKILQFVSCISCQLCVCVCVCVCALFRDFAYVSVNTSGDSNTCHVFRSDNAACHICDALECVSVGQTADGQPLATADSSGAGLSPVASGCSSTVHRPSSLPHLVATARHQLCQQSNTTLVAGCFTVHSSLYSVQ